MSTGIFCEDTLAPTAALGLAPSRQIWARHRDLGVEYFGYCAGGSRGHPNEDAIVTEDLGAQGLLLGVFDEASQKRGLASGTALGEAVDTIREAPAARGTVIRLADASRALHARLLRSGPFARAGVSATLLLIGHDGWVQWASVGDTGLVRLRARHWWRRAGVERTSTAQRTVGGRLVHALGTPNAPQLEQGAFRFVRGDLLLLASDGVLHESLDLAELGRLAPDAGARVPTLRDAGLSMVAEGRLSQSRPDDIGLLIVARR